MDYVPVLNKKSVFLPITTRGAGFMVRSLVCRLANLRIGGINYHQLAGALYRTTLLAIEGKLFFARRSAFCCEGFRQIDIGVDFERALSRMYGNFWIIIDYIKALGTFTARSVRYVPMLPDDSIVNNVNVYDPCYITFSNLRQYVVAMSTTDTPLDHRTYFYDHSPIPNASWTVTMVGDGTEGGQIRSPTLSNPDEIMPDQYGMADLISDIKIIMTAVTIVERKYPNFTSRERIDYTAKGHPRQLTSCTASEIRCTDIGNDYAISDAISGNCDFYWSLGNLSSSVLFPGVRCLFGEVPRHSNHGTFATRQYQAAAVSFSTDFIYTLHDLKHLKY